MLERAARRRDFLASAPIAARQTEKLIVCRYHRRLIQDGYGRYIRRFVSRCILTRRVALRRWVVLFWGHETQVASIENVVALNSLPNLSVNNSGADTVTDSLLYTDDSSTILFVGIGIIIVSSLKIKCIFQ